MKMKVLTAITLSTIIGLSSSVSVNVSGVKSVFAANEESKLFFYDSTSDGSALDHIKKVDKKIDDSFEKIKLEYGDFSTVDDSDVTMNMNLNKYDEIAFPLELVKEDEQLRNHLRLLLMDGKQVFLYGDVYLDEFEELLNIKNKITPPVSDKDMKKENTNTHKGSPRIYINSSESFNVVGYSNDPSIPIYTADFQNENGESIEGKDFMNLRAILDSKSKTKKIKEENSKKLFRSLTANAAIEAVYSVPDTNSYAYVGSTSILKGQINTDYVLRQDNSESDATYDYFGVEPHYEYTGYNQANPKGANVRLELPLSPDHLYEWGPKDSGTGTTSFSFSLSYPGGVGFSVSFTPGGSYDIDEKGSQTNDYGLWVLTDGIGTLPNPTRFKPSITWQSTGTWARANLITDASFYDPLIGTYYAYQNIQLSYNY